MLYLATASGIATRSDLPGGSAASNSTEKFPACTRTYHIFSSLTGTPQSTSLGHNNTECCTYRYIGTGQCQATGTSLCGLYESNGTGDPVFYLLLVSAPICSACAVAVSHCGAAGRAERTKINTEMMSIIQFQHIFGRL